MTFICSIPTWKGKGLGKRKVECSESFKTFEELFEHVNTRHSERSRGWITVVCEEP